jgi:hypothetical protein
MSKSSKESKKPNVVSDNEDSDESEQESEQSEESYSLITKVNNKDLKKMQDNKKSKKINTSNDSEVSDKELDESDNQVTKEDTKKDTKKNPAKRKTKKEHVKSLNEKIELIIDKEKTIRDEILDLKKSLHMKEKDREKLSDEKDKLIDILKLKTSAKETKIESSDTKKSNTGFAKPVLVPKVLQSFLKLGSSDKELSMTEITSLLSNKLIEDAQKEDKLYIFNEKTLKELKLTIDSIKANISEKALQNIVIKDNSIKIPYIYLKSLLKILYN